MRRLTKALMVVAVITLAGLWIFRAAKEGPTPGRVPYSELVADIEAGKVAEAQIQSQEVMAVLKSEGGKPGERVVAERIPNMDDRALLDAMSRHNVVVTGQEDHSSPWGPLLWTILPLLLLPLLLWGSSSLAQGARGRPMTFGRSKAKLYDRSEEQGVTFGDVAGVDDAKAELMEVVRFLREPLGYHKMGAHVPKGVLLVGAPGTGKTLLARAVAGESRVPFFTLSGSEFVEMFVGVGASRVRDMFEQAKLRAPCIIFIDELDAVGKARSGAAGFAANEEREQTLNQLLVEMDGFAPGMGLIIMAATNRPEILDRALLRAGRFDRQILVDRPDLRGREAILRVHARKVQLAPDVDLSVVARRTPGMVGADLANVVNEAALAAVRRNATAASLVDFEEAIDRLQLGLKKEGRMMNEDEKRRVAFHEAGHALVAMTVDHVAAVHRVTIIPRSIGALGATLQLPTAERFLMTRGELRDRLCVLLAGRAAEEVACGDISTGAKDDLEQATLLAREMVCRFGMSEALGPITLGRSEAMRFLVPMGDAGDRDYSEETGRAIDAEVRRSVEDAHRCAVDILRDRHETLSAIATELVAKETIEGAELEAIVRPSATIKAPRRVSA